MFGIRLAPELNARIKEFLEDREDYLLGTASLERNEPRTTLADLRKELGLER
ncbi:MAG: hypothetical protein M3Y57_02795 [Acidobacteriota bacterium]|nr:hypothetical protein [Acidobacteriota bacterium]